MKILDPLPNPKILSLLLTLQCNAQCRHCGTLSGPKVKSRLDVAVARRLIREAKALDYDSLVFTGGEPMMYGEELFELLTLGHSLGLPTRIVTNGFWAKDRQRADAMLHRLVDAGLGEINFSTGDEHARFVPLTNIVWGIRAGLDVGITVAVMIEVVEGRTVSLDALKQHPVFRSSISDDEAEQVTFSESPWMPLDDQELANYPPGLAANATNIGRRLGCDSVINTSTVMADGRMMACCGLGTLTIPELQIGDVARDSLAAVRARAESDFLKRWIRNEGPERILMWAASKDPGIEWEDRYAHRCQACKRLYSDQRVRSVIRAHYEEKILDVLYSEWLLHEFVADDDALDSSSSVVERSAEVEKTGC